jgi:succinyl-CoA synthetase beta subunit
MDLHEFQAKAILAERGIPVPAGDVAWTREEATAVAARIGGDTFAVKAQILAGGRGAAGGVRIAKSAAEVGDIAGAMLGTTLVTAQTSGGGRPVRRVYVEKGVECRREIYVAVAIDRAAAANVLLASAEGGETIEETVARDPKALHRIIFTAEPPSEDALKNFAAELGLDDVALAPAAGLFAALAKAFLDLDASLIEINPLCIAADGTLLALDVKMSVENSALFRQPAIAGLRDDEDEDPVELEAQRYDLNFVRMDGDIGVVVNGAGLALATHDSVIDAGGRPANFMDIRTTATSLQIARGIGLLLGDPQVKSILVNVHGGGMTRCDTIVEALQIARSRSGRSVPIVLRAAGQNADYARQMMSARRIPHELAATIGEAARRAVALAQGTL